MDRRLTEAEKREQERRDADYRKHQQDLQDSIARSAAGVRAAGDKIRRIEATAAIEAGARAHSEWLRNSYSPAFRELLQLQTGFYHSHIDNATTKPWIDKTRHIVSNLSEQLEQMGPALLELSSEITKCKTQLELDIREILEYPRTEAATDPILPATFRHRVIFRDPSEPLGGRLGLNRGFIHDIKTHIQKCRVISSATKATWLDALKTAEKNLMFVFAEPGWGSIPQIRDMVENDISETSEILGQWAQKASDLFLRISAIAGEKRSIDLMSDIAYRNALHRIHI